MPKLEVVPYLSVSNANQALDYYSRVFDTAPHLLLKMPDGRVMHCEFRVGGGRFFMSDELTEHGGTPSPATLGATSVAVHLYVEDCDALIAKMTNEGATVLADPEDMFWGERFGRVRDPFGHEWAIATQLCEMTPEEIKAAADELFAKMGN